MKTIPLNIMLSYPVKWTKHQVLRDIVQNFYDEAGMLCFNKKFKTKYTIDDNTVTISLGSKGFSYEWLLHMGASTKQGKTGEYAGFFGEGFKVASLCALRDYGWKIAMRSRNWHIEVCTLSITVDGKTLQQLAYNLTEGLPNSSETSLTIQPFSKDDSNLLDEVVLGFYFPENPLFAKCIFNNKAVAIYERSKQSKPKSMPAGLKVNGDGIVYIAFQARGAFTLPLVICHHKFTIDNRDRYDIYFGTILDIFIDLIDYIDAKTSCYLLEKFEKYWYDYPDNKNDVDSWYSVIRKLIRKIAYTDTKVRNDFVKRHTNLVVCERPTSIHTRNQKTQALIWKEGSLPDACLVQDSFSLLGYNTIVELCEKAGGFNIVRNPDSHEQNTFKILETTAKEIFKDFFSFYPACLIIENDSSVYNGTAYMIKNNKIMYNCCGYRIRYRLEKIAIRRSSFAKESFVKAFSTYCHELCHCFGGDASMPFSRALTEVITLTMKNDKVLENSNRLWKNCFVDERARS